MTELMKLMGGALIACACAVAVKKSGSAVSYAPSVIAVAVLVGSALTTVCLALTPMAELVSEDSESYISLMLKALGIGMTVKTVCDICRELGEDGIAGAVELIGRAELVLLCVPLIKSTVSLLRELMY